MLTLEIVIATTTLKHIVTISAVKPIAEIIAHKMVIVG